MAVIHLPGPCRWSGPRRAASFDGIRPAGQKQLHEVRLSPATCPTERSALKQVIANIRPRAAIEQLLGEWQMLWAPSRHHGVEDGRAATGGVWIGTFEQ